MKYRNGLHYGCIDLQISSFSKQKAKGAPKRKHVAVFSYESEADSSTPLISVFSKTRSQKKRSTKTIALADVVSPAPLFQAAIAQAPVQPVVPVSEAQLVSKTTVQEQPALTKTVQRDLLFNQNHLLNY